MSEKKTYHTKQHDDIMRCIRSFNGAHFTAAELAARLSVGQSTVYRRIDRLAVKGILRKYVIDGSSAACYQYVEPAAGVGDCRTHFHLKCEICGRLLHTQCEELEKISAHIEAEHGFEIDSSKTVFYGICPDCRGRQSTEDSSHE